MLEQAAVSAANIITRKIISARLIALRMMATKLHISERPNSTIAPKTLGNMRENGVRTLAAWCLCRGCDHPLARFPALAAPRLPNGLEIRPVAFGFARSLRI